MSVTLQRVKNKKQRKDFVDLPFEIYKGNAYWVPPLKSEEMKSLLPDSHPALRFCEVEYWVAYRQNKPVGRIAAIINHQYNEKTGKKFGRFSKLEFFDDPEVFKALLNKAVSWVKEKGMTHIHGPLGFTNLDNQGLLIEGFDYIPSVASVYHLPYYRKYLEDYGFEKEADWVEFRLNIGEKAVEKARYGAALIKKRFGLEIMRFTSKKEMLSYAPVLFKLVNRSFTSLPYVVPFDEEMVKFYTQKYFGVIDPQYVFFVKKEEEIIGFLLAVPSLSEALQKAGGKLFPFGFYHVRKAMKHPDVIDLFLGGVKPEYERTGAAVVLYAELQDQMLRNGIRIIETTGEFESNRHVINHWKNFDHIQHKRRRCFVKALK
ncbi:GNAT family N-acetyltransferase [Candidatus Sulfidibacterium hydrothermale]|uniref:GNAT family N-acetyltransferase n=1 Tax=Candidatus Sulfidibacterium hydrothermale TaxID=2875962 RepID=UPI001F0B0C84|nr:GNAT family N-acetyltransferase [Candidatus Sulfidibacterium hydrothermale]UBM63263.1 GNAT family N-acetyltransferase [Candidatus Sulfidibacterium hydrothermale]